MSHEIKGSWKDTQFVVLLPFSLPAALSSPLASRLLCKTPAEMEKRDGWQRAKLPGRQMPLIALSDTLPSIPGVETRFFVHSRVAQRTNSPQANLCKY